jgi:ABC-type antimicrobial peptide transport system permease subunit
MPWKLKLQHNIRIFKYSIVLAIRSMRHRSFRTILTIIGIVIGITTFTALMSVGVGARSQIYQVLNQFSGASMIVMSKLSTSRPSIPGGVADYLEEIPGVNYTVGLIEDFASFGTSDMVIITGVESEEMEFLLGLKVIEGVRLVDAKGIDRACVIDTTLQETIHAHVNETIVATSSLTGQLI